MSNLRQAAQQALEALEWNYNTDLDNIPACEQWAKMLNETIPALKQALAEPEPLGWITAGQHTAPIRTHWEGCEAVHPECRKPEPVALPCCEYANASAVKWNPHNQVVQCHNCGQIYTAPTPRKPLTDEEIVAIGNASGLKAKMTAVGIIIHPDGVKRLARAIERDHGIGDSK